MRIRHLSWDCYGADAGGVGRSAVSDHHGGHRGRRRRRQRRGVAGRDVEVRNVDTNFTRTLVTDRDGRFVALQLPPGRYTLTFKLAGFATLVQENIQVTVGQSARLNPVMKVSGVAETVTVTSQAATVETSRTAAATTLNERTIGNTPILGRKFEDLLTLTPGVSVVQGPDGDEITFSGQRGVFNNISLDGGDYNNGFFGEQMGGQRAAVDITLEAVKEFQVVATGANAEFGRTAGGVVNVITKSGTNQLKGSLFHFQRLEGLTSNTSDGKPLTDFHREQFGGTAGGPLVKNKAFFFGARRRHPRAPAAGQSRRRDRHAMRRQQSDARGQRGADQRQPRLPASGASELLPPAAVRRKGSRSLTTSTIRRRWPSWIGTWALANNLSVTYNFDYSKNLNQTFDVATYGNSANGTEGPSKINILNVNLFSTVTANKLNEFHVTYSRENRPRSSTPSTIPADTGIGFAPVVPFRNPFFLAAGVDELVKRFQIKDNFSIVTGKHTIKTGGEWLHTNNVQVFRGFFQGRYLFDSVTGFLRYTSPAAAGGFGPSTIGCSEWHLRHRAGVVSGWYDGVGWPAVVLSAEQQSGRHRPRCGGLFRYRQRGVRAVRPGQVAGRPRPDHRLRFAMGCSADARDGRSHRPPRSRHF